MRHWFEPIGDGQRWGTWQSNTVVTLAFVARRSFSTPRGS